MVRETVSNRVYREVVAVGVNIRDIAYESAAVVKNSSRELSSTGEIKGG
jgi:hypothetical protein